MDVPTMSNEQKIVQLSAIRAAVKAGNWDRPVEQDEEEGRREMTRFVEDDFSAPIPGPLYTEQFSTDGKGEYGRIC